MKKVTNTKHKYINIAKRVASKGSPNSSHRHGCVIVRGGAIISTGYNCKRTHPVSHTYGKHSCHAEQRAVIAALRRGVNLRGASIYVTHLYGKHSSPCAMCHDIIKQAGIQRVYYTDLAGRIHKYIIR